MGQCARIPLLVASAAVFLPMTTRTVSANLAEMIAEIKTVLRPLLETHSSIHHQPTEVWGGEVQRGPFGRRRTPGFVAVGYSAWKPLSQEGTRAQSAALNRYQEFAALAIVLLSGQPQKVQAAFKESDRVVMGAIQQVGLPAGSTTQEILRDVHRALDRELSLIAALYDGSSTETIVVPDTNALLYNPHIEDWTFDDLPRFTIVLLPTVLAELDSLKVSHRNEQLRDKSEGLITRIKGYRTRGRLNDGVPLRKGVSTLQSWATEPSMDATLPWLVRDNADDRLLANFLEIMRHFPHSIVVLVTRDINLQNKAEFARVPFCDPPQAKTPQSP